MVDTEQLRRDFLNSAKRGTGESYLIIRDNPNVDFSRELIRVCVKDFAYDGQCEGNRASYLFDMITLSRKQENIKAAIIKRLDIEDRDTWTLVQLFDLAKTFAQHGANDARQAIYDRYLKNPILGSDWASYHQILELDGTLGLFYIAEAIGRSIEANPDDLIDDYIPDQFQKDNPDIDVMANLESAAISNSYIGLFLAKVKQAKVDQANYQREKPVFRNVVDEVLNFNGRGRLINRKWTNDELNLIADALTIEKNRKKLAKLLLPFFRNKFLGDFKIVLNFAKKYSSERNELGRNAINALCTIEDATVRQFAIKSMQIGKKPERFVGLLKANYKSGDDKLLTAIIENTTNEVAVERLTLDCLSIFENQKTPECRKPLEALYNKMTCGICRSDVVKVLLKNDVLSLKIKSEIPFDCNADTRLLSKDDHAAD
jgi:hypothetical protein